MPGFLTLVATPLGNLGDLSDRTRAALTEADAWIVEDSRVSGKLAQHLGVRKQMWIVNEHTRPAKIREMVEQVANGMRVALLTDAGTPGISDPGAIFADFAHEEEITVDAIPGPSAVTLALSLSGFFAQRFTFLGFLGRRAGDIRREIAPYEDSTQTLVLFESPYRVDALLRVIYEVLGERRYAICRELTKAHQQVVRETLPNLPNEQKMPRKGEFTIVIEGKRRARGDSGIVEPGMVSSALNRTDG